MKNNVLLLLLLLFIWIFGGLWLYHQCCCSASVPAAVVPTVSSDGLLIKDNTYFEATAPSNVAFETQKATYTMPQEVQAAFTKTATYLKEHPAKVLTINTPTTELGKQRGEAVANYLIEKNKVALSQVAVKQHTTESLKYKFDCVEPLIIKAENTTFNCFDNFVFERSNFELAAPPSKELNQTLEQIATYLKKNPTVQLDITGWQLASEENNSTATSLGKARAGQVRSILLEQYGVPPNQVNYNGLEKESLNFVKNQHFKKELLFGGLDFIFSKKEKENTTTSATRIKTLEKDLLVTPRRLYFATGKNQILIDDKFRKYFEEVLYYLENVPTASLECSGHTDNTGNATKNKELAQERADFVAAYFAKQGIPANRIKTVSLGQDKPIETNKTAKGRAKNRRVEIIVK